MVFTPYGLKKEVLIKKIIILRFITARVVPRGSKGLFDLLCKKSIHLRQPESQTIQGVSVIASQN